MKVAFTSNNTINFMGKAYGKISGNREIFMGGYNQYMFDLSSLESELAKFTPDFIVIDLDGEELLKVGDTDSILQHLKLLVNAIQLNYTHSYILFNTIFIPNRVNTIDNYNKISSHKDMQVKINQFLQNTAIENAKIFMIDTLSIIEQYGTRNIFNNSTWVFGNIRYNNKGNKLIANAINNTINSILNKTAKCLVLDLDNTLWGGVIGEDGMDGILLGNEKIGLVFKNFQQEIKKIQQKGILLALCSKNNESDAKIVFDEHPDMQLHWDDFIIRKVNWQVKSQNIHKISTELNIGEDSLVFLDDNPMERDIVKVNTMAHVPEFPQEPENLLDFISEVDLQYFSKQQILPEDLEKTQQYQINQKRTQEKKLFSNYDDYIKSLDIKLSISKNNMKQVARISQLTQKTNQFNFTTHRYSPQDIINFMEFTNHTVYSGSVKDKFGEYGLVVVAIVQHSQDISLIDTFLMSCRVIGKQIENGFMDFIHRDLHTNLQSSYQPTAKNILVKDKMEQMGFNLKKEEHSHKEYQLSFTQKINFNHNITVDFNET